MVVPITRSEFEDLIAHHIGVVEQTILTALADAEVEPGSVSRVVRTGGSSSIPVFVEMVTSIFDPAVMEERPPFTTVVRGLGSYAQGVWS